MATFTDDLEETDGGDASGRGLRKQLEQALTQNRQLQEQLSVFTAKEVVTAKGFDLVTPEDLKGVTPDKIEETAQKLQTERADLQAKLLKAALAKYGIEDDALEDAVAGITNKESAEEAGAEAAQRIRSLGGADTRPVPPVNLSKLTGLDAIKAGLDESKRSRSR